MKSTLLALFLVLTGSRGFVINGADSGVVMVSRQVVSNSLTVITNHIVLKVGSDAARLDLPGEVSVLSWAAKSGTVELYHSERVYLKRVASTSRPADAQVVSSGVDWFPGNWDGRKVDRLYWTNGSSSGLFMAARPTDFFPSLTGVSGEIRPPVLGMMVGTMMSSNRMLIRSVISNVVNVPASALRGSQAVGLTNLTYSIESVLQSITVTNVPDLDFQIPEGYTEVKEYVRGTVTPPAGIMGPGPSQDELNKLQMLRARLGQAPLELPSSKPFLK